MPLVYDGTINRIMLIGRGRHDEIPCAAAGSIQPGMAVTIDSTGKAIVAAGSTATMQDRAIAMENPLVGKTVEDAYAPGDIVFVHYPLPGDVGLVYVLAANAVTCGGTGCPISGGGFVSAPTGSGTRPIGIFLETKGVTANDQLVKFRFW